MARPTRLLLVFLGLLALIVVRDIVVDRHVLPRALIQPPPNTIARTFVQAVVTGDVELAIPLTDGSQACVENMMRSVEWFARDYQGVDADKVHGTVMYSREAPASELIDFTFYSSESWPETAQVATLPATYSLLGRRYTCGTVFAD